MRAHRKPTQNKWESEQRKKKRGLVLNLPNQDKALSKALFSGTNQNTQKQKKQHRHTQLIHLVRIFMGSTATKALSSRSFVFQETLRQWLRRPLALICHHDDDVGETLSINQGAIASSSSLSWCCRNSEHQSRCNSSNASVHSLRKPMMVGASMCHTIKL